MFSFLRELPGKIRYYASPEVRRLYKENDYISAYARHTDLRVAADPKGAIGGRWDEIGRLQFDFLVEEGLSPESTLLDLGCGTLRGGRRFIRHLEPGNYTGVDISPKVIEVAREAVEEEGLGDKRPELILNPSGALDFAQFEGRTFDFILAQSVFTHLMEVHIAECLASVHKVMTPKSRFCFTFFEAAKPARLTAKDFAYPFSFFADLAGRHGLAIRNASDRYPHPRDQKMAVVSLPD